MGLADKLRSLDQAAVRVAKPTTAKTVTAKTVTAKTVTAKPPAAKPAAAQPARKPAAPKRAPAKPAAAKPVPARPVAAEPAAAVTTTTPAIVTTAPLPAAPPPPVPAPVLRTGRAPRVRALGWRVVALVAAVLATGGRRGLLGPAGAVVVGLVLTVWWGPWFYLGLGIVTAAAWIWAMKTQPHEPTENNY